MNELTILLMLIGGHAIGDYALQSDYIAIEKTKSLYILFIHAMIWTVTISVIWIILGNTLTLVKILFVLLLPHVFMDYCKAQSKWFPKLIKNTNIQLAVDQSFHYIQLIVLLLVR